MELPEEVRNDPAYIAYYKAKKSAEDWRKRKKEWKKRKGWKKIKPPPKNMKVYFIDPSSL